MFHSYLQVRQGGGTCRAYWENSNAVMRAYGFDIKTSAGASCVKAREKDLLIPVEYDIIHHDASGLG
jgi:hypothetical protein